MQSEFIPKIKSLDHTRNGTFSCVFVNSSDKKLEEVMEKWKAVVNSEKNM